MFRGGDIHFTCLLENTVAVDLRINLLKPSNYWLRLSRIWKILQIKDGGQQTRPRWITPSEICRILHIVRKPNSIIFPPPLGRFAISLPGFLGRRFSNLQRAALLMSSVQYDKGLFKFGQQQLVMVSRWICAYYFDPPASSTTTTFI